MAGEVWKRRTWRAWKLFRAALLRAAGRFGGPPRPVFVVGAQRSGTRLPMVVMERSPDIGTYAEGNSRFFNGVLLKPDHEVARTLNRLPFQAVALKPICESHRARELLERFPGSRVIWIYRDYRYATRSSERKWKGGIKELELLATGRLKEAGWRAGGLTEEKLRLVRRHYDPAMSRHSAYAMKWFLRTGLFFDIGLAGRDDVLLVRYEDLATDPVAGFQRMFAFIGAEFREAFVRDVYASSVATGEVEGLDPEIESLCMDLLERMDAYYESQPGPLRAAVTG